MRIDAVVLHRLQMPLKLRFETSFGEETERVLDLVEVHGEGAVGYGEGVALSAPVYSEETVDTARVMMERFFIPALLAEELPDAAAVTERLARFHGNRMAKAALECAVWDLEAQLKGVPLWRLLGGVRPRIPVGVSLGIEPDLARLLDEVDRHVALGYRRIKLKVKPGWDEAVLEAVRQRHPEVPLSVDANTAYGPKDVPRLAGWARYRLEYVEQPFPEDDWLSHQALQQAGPLKVCLDESIRSLADAHLALALGACRVINVKIGRLGGLEPARRLAQLASAHGVDLWCGGMLETGVGRLANVAITTLQAFTLPGDTAGSDRYWDEDLIEPPVVVEDGFITAPEGPGLGHRLLPERLAAHRQGPPQVFRRA